MPGPYGVQPSGFVIKPAEDIQADLEADYRATFGDGINLTPSSSIGMEIGIATEQLAETWEVLEAIYNATTADGSDGAQQDNVCALTGTVREPAKLTHVLATLTGTAGTTVPKFSQASIVGTGVKFQSLADAVIGGGGTVAGVEFAALVYGPSPAYAGTLTTIETPRAGWTGITNPADHFVLGADLEADPDLRVRRETELRAQGNAANEAIREKLLQVAGVTDCIVFENETDTTDGNGLPPHSIEVLVEGGTDADVFAAVYASKGAGIETYGSTSGTVTGGDGLAHAINFSRPSVLTLYVIANVSIDAATFPADGDTQIKNAIAAYGLAHYHPGTKVISSALGAQAFTISGVTDAPPVLVGTPNPPTSSANITPTVRQLPSLDTSRITVNHV